MSANYVLPHKYYKNAAEQVYILRLVSNTEIVNKTSSQLSWWWE